MAREHETASQQKWGTLEELLLACAVNRHGTKSWDSIAMEVQNRSSSLSSLTPQNCRDKFNDLRRRYMSQNNAESTSLLPLVDQLRQIRVQELRVEVQRRDVSIVSLELKVKKLEEEMEKSLKTEADLGRDRKASPEIVAGKSSAVDGDGDSDECENRSFNESNSTTQKAETTNKKQSDDVEEEKEPKIKPEPGGENDPVQDRTRNEADGEDRDWSSNGKLNENLNGNVKVDNNEDNTKTVSEEKVVTIKNKTSGVGGLSESNELWEDKTKREGKQSSDVQSSASLSKSKRRRTGGAGVRNGGGGGTAGCSSVEEPDVEEVSPTTKKMLAIKSEPLARFLGMIRSHRLGSQFERRLRSQESERYKKLIRQHIDLQTIQSRLDRGLYSDCFHRFFRDFLMLFNNFVIFFRKSSQEFAAAQELRGLVIKEMSDKLQKQKPKPKPKPLVTVKREPEQPPVSLSKPSRASTMVVCGKRSTVKAISENNAKRNKGDKKEREVEEKPKANEKKIDNSFVGVEERGVKKKSNQERSISGRRNSKSNKKKSGEVNHQYGGNELSSHDALEVKMNNKKENAVKKKQGVASFLKRMKQNSPVEDDSEEEEVEEEANDDLEEEEEEESKDSKVEEEKKRRSGRKNNLKNERVTRSSRGRGVREESGRVKRGVGRPPKRLAATSPPDTTGKRGRDNGESEFSRSRKRTRR